MSTHYSRSLHLVEASERTKLAYWPVRNAPFWDWRAGAESVGLGNQYESFARMREDAYRRMLEDKLRQDEYTLSEEPPPSLAVPPQALYPPGYGVM